MAETPCIERLLPLFLRCAHSTRNLTYNLFAFIRKHIFLQKSSLHHEPGSNHVYGVAGEAGGESGQYTRSQVTAGALRNKLCPRQMFPGEIVDGQLDPGHDG